VHKECAFLTYKQVVSIEAIIVDAIINVVEAKGEAEGEADSSNVIAEGEVVEAVEATVADEVAVVAVEGTVTIAVTVVAVEVTVTIAVAVIAVEDISHGGTSRRCQHRYYHGRHRKNQLDASHYANLLYFATPGGWLCLYILTRTGRKVCARQHKNIYFTPQTCL
jgi:hypothetical protein